jgi:hypothetical protein
MKKREEAEAKERFFRSPQAARVYFEFGRSATAPHQKTGGGLTYIYILGFSETQNASKVSGRYRD